MKNGVHADTDKVTAIKDMETPKNKKELLRFLGMTNYVSKFIPNYRQMIPFFVILQKTKYLFILGSTQQDTYDKLKQLL